jgi:hypothetical protein
MFREAEKEGKRIPFLCLWDLWVIRFGKFIAPRRYHEAGAAEVEAFLRSLVAVVPRGGR